MEASSIKERNYWATSAFGKVDLCPKRGGDYAPQKCKHWGAPQNEKQDEHNSVKWDARLLGEHPYFQQ